MSEKKIVPTDEQVAIIDAARTSSKNIMCKSYAGCTKTTTIEMMGRALPVRPTLYLVFNVRNKKEAEARMPPHIHCKTVNGLGNEAWNRTTGRRCIVDVDKLSKILKNVIKSNPEFQGTSREQWGDVLNLINRARVSGLIPEQFVDFQGLIPDTEEGWQEIANQIWLEINEGHIYLAREVLILSIKMAFQGTIDYTDQIYMSALFGGAFTKYPEVMLDESQDLSPLMHMMVAKAAIARLTAVGDPLQAIYAFRGADSASMEKIRSLKEDWVDLPLTLTFRCPKLTVARQQGHAPGYRAHESNPEGEHFFLAKQAWGIDTIEDLAANGHITFLCRNNAPIIAAALRIIRSERGCTVLGREIGKSLVTLSKKILPDERASITMCAEKVNEWATRETSLATVAGKDARVAVIQDKKECLLAILESPLCKDAGTMRDLLDHMFEGSNIRITLSTGHKAKGGEWPTIVSLDPWRIPSKYALAEAARGNPIPHEQDMNLKYVIETRSQATTIFADLEEMK